MNPTDEMGPKPSEMFDVLETAGFAALSTAAQGAMHASETLTRARAWAKENDWPEGEQRDAALREILYTLDSDVLPRLQAICRDTGVGELFEHARIWDRAPALSG